MLRKKYSQVIDHFVLAWLMTRHCSGMQLIYNLASVTWSASTKYKSCAFKMVPCAFVPQERLEKERNQFIHFNLKPRREKLGIRFTIIRHARIVAWLFLSKLLFFSFFDKVLWNNYKKWIPAVIKLDIPKYSNMGLIRHKGTYTINHFWTRYRKRSHDLVGLFSASRRSRRQNRAWLSWNYGNGGRKTAWKQRSYLISKWTNSCTTNPDEPDKKSNVMWPFTSEIRIRMDLLWRGFAVLVVLFAAKLDATSSSSVLSSGFASSVLPSISSSTLFTRIQSISSRTNGGVSTAELSSTYGKIRYPFYAFIAN